MNAAAKAAGLVAGFHGTPRETRLAPNEFKTTGGSTLGAGAYFSEGKTQADRYDFRGDAQMYFLDVELPGFDEFNKGLTTEEIAAGKTTPLEGTGKNGGWIVQNGEVEFVVRDPSQIKSADPFTGVSLDKRFDSTNNNIQNSQPINLGDKFSFRLANSLRNSSDAFLGLKIANDGTLPTQSLIAKVRKSGINEFEVEKLTNLVNSLEINGRVNIDELSEAVDNEPTVIINTLDFGGTSNSKPYQIEIQNLTVKKNEIFHKIDTEFSGWTYQYLSVFTSPDGKSMPLSQAIEAEPRGRSMPQKMQDYVNQAIEIQKQISSIQLDNEGVIDMSESGSATGRYGVDPYSNEQLKELKKSLQDTD